MLGGKIRFLEVEIFVFFQMIFLQKMTSKSRQNAI